MKAFLLTNDIICYLHLPRLKSIFLPVIASRCKRICLNSVNISSNISFILSSIPNSRRQHFYEPRKPQAGTYPNIHLREHMPPGTAPKTRSAASSRLLCSRAFVFTTFVFRHFCPRKHAVPIAVIFQPDQVVALITVHGANILVNTPTCGN